MLWHDSNRTPLNVSAHLAPLQSRPFFVEYCLFVQPAKMAKRMDQQAKKKELEELR